MSLSPLSLLSQAVSQATNQGPAKSIYDSYVTPLLERTQKLSLAKIWANLQVMAGTSPLDKDAFYQNVREDLHANFEATDAILRYGLQLLESYLEGELELDVPPVLKKGFHYFRDAQEMRMQMREDKLAGEAKLKEREAALVEAAAKRAARLKEILAGGRGAMKAAADEEERIEEERRKADEARRKKEEEAAAPKKTAEELAQEMREEEEKLPTICTGVAVQFAYLFKKTYLRRMRSDATMRRVSDMVFDFLDTDHDGSIAVEDALRLKGFKAAFSIKEGVRSHARVKGLIEALFGVSWDGGDSLSVRTLLSLSDRLVRLLVQLAEFLMLTTLDVVDETLATGLEVRVQDGPPSLHLPSPFPHPSLTLPRVQDAPLPAARPSSSRAGACVSICDGWRCLPFWCGGAAPRLDECEHHGWRRRQGDHSRAHRGVCTPVCRRHQRRVGLQAGIDGACQASPQRARHARRRRRGPGGGGANG